VVVTEINKVHQGQYSEEKWTDFQDTGVTIYHAPTGSHFQIRAKVQQGEGKVFVNGIPITELIESGRIKRLKELLQVLTRERLKAVNVELQVGDSQLPEVLSSPVLAYAIAEALTNLLGRL
jgi:hypothetical protein